MRSSELRIIASILNQVDFKSKEYYAYIAPALKEHYEDYINLIFQEKENQGVAGLEQLLCDKNTLINLNGKITSRVDILIDTDLYVTKRHPDKLDHYVKATQFNDEHENYIRNNIGEKRWNIIADVPQPQKKQ